MELYFIRHGQSENNLLWSQTGSSSGRSHDPELTEIGRRQARRLALFLKEAGAPPAEQTDPRANPQNRYGFGLTHLYCSLMLRAIQTAVPVAEALGLPLHAWLDIHEEGGIYLDDEAYGGPRGLPGSNQDYLQTHFPSLVLPEELDPAGWWNRPFELDEERPVRARRFLETLIKRHGGTQDRVAIFSHGGFYNHLLTALLNAAPQPETWFVLHNAAITRIDFVERVRLVYLNRTDFLPEGWIT